MKGALTLRFMECDDCGTKPGTPPLCAGCLHNRAVIEAFDKAARKPPPGLRPKWWRRAEKILNTPVTR